MRFFDRLFRKRGGITFTPDFVDLRGADERRMERRAESSLDGEDEQLAQKLVDLVQRYDSLWGTDRPAADTVQQEIKSIGEGLCANGGGDRMKRIAYRIATLGAGKGVSRGDMERHWCGICGWW